MNGAESLLSYLDAPIVVGDPDGRAVYTNPAFEERFPRAGQSALGLPLAELFDGGAREAVLRGVVSACEKRETARFRLRAGDIGYSAVASPIQSGKQAVGVVILFKEELGAAERLLQLQREMQGALEDLGGTLDELLEQTGGRRNPQHRALVEDGIRTTVRLRKWSEEMEAAIAGRPAAASEERIPTLEVLARIVERVARIAANDGVALNLLVPGSLPEVVGDEARFSGVITRMLEARAFAKPAPERVTVGARVIGAGRERALLVSFSELRSGGYEVPFADAPIIDEALGQLGASTHGFASPRLGRSTVVRIPLDLSEARGES
ncbi:MAG TPA: PAS domain-containing protein [Myxococcota bacterium]|nr:PAS domain-containing protein [Myxococcota bacterium]